MLLYDTSTAFKGYMKYVQRCIVQRAKNTPKMYRTTRKKYLKDVLCNAQKHTSKMYCTTRKNIPQRCIVQRAKIYLKDVLYNAQKYTSKWEFCEFLAVELAMIVPFENSFCIIL